MSRTQVMSTRHRTGRMAHLFVALFVATIALTPPIAGMQSTTPAGASLLVNGSFEEGPAPGSYVNLPGGTSSITGWVVTGEGLDYIGNLWRGSHGQRSLDLDGSARSRATPPYAQGGIAQTFPTAPGTAYIVRFDMAGNPYGAPAKKPLRVTAAGQHTELTFDVAGRSASHMGWTTQTWTFTARDASTTLEFHSLTTAPATGYGATIDNVSVVASGGSQAAAAPAPAPARPGTAPAKSATPAQSTKITLNAMYECPGGHGFKVISCSGFGDADPCDVQSYVNGQPSQRGPAPHKQVLVLLPLCRVQVPGQPAPPVATPAAAAQAGGTGIKVGDTVKINTAFGWTNAVVLAVNGHLFRVRASIGTGCSPGDRDRSWQPMRAVCWNWPDGGPACRRCSLCSRTWATGNRVRPPMRPRSWTKLPRSAIAASGRTLSFAICAATLPNPAS